MSARSALANSPGLTCCSDMVAGVGVCDYCPKPMSRHSPGGIAHGKIERAAAIAAYMLSPKTCRGCGTTLLPTETGKIAALKKRRFCDRSCAAKHNNRLHGGKRKRTPRLCAKCGIDTKAKRQRKYCAGCYRNPDIVAAKTRGECSRKEIQNHARSVVAKRLRECANCGYAKHVEMCHVRAVTRFRMDDMVGAINDQRNLLLLCPNCHWELDRGRLDPKPLLLKL